MRKPLTLSVLLFLPAAAACGVGSARPHAALGVDGGRLALGRFEKSMTIIDSGGRAAPYGMLVQTVQRETLGGVAGLLSVQTFDGTSGTTIDSAFADAQTLSPIWQWSHNSARVMQLEFHGRRVTGSYAPTGNPVTNIEQDLAQAPFDANVQDLVIAALPLAAGFHARVPVYIYERDGLVWYDVSVTGREDLPAALGGGWAWTVTLSSDHGPSGRYWITDRPRAVVRSEFGMPDGRTFRIERHVGSAVPARPGSGSGG